MRFTLLLSFLCIAQFSFSQPILKEASPETVGMSGERIKNIDRLLQEYIDKKWIAGGAAIVARDGKIVYYKALGNNGNSSYKRDDIFRIASQTKAITSVAIMTLYEEGKLLLNDPVGKFIPEFNNQQVIDKFNKADTTYTTVPAKRPVTIRDLLTHTAGLGYAQIGDPQATAIYYKNGIIGGLTSDKVYLADKIKKLGTLPLLLQPGERWMYSLSVDVLGYVVEVISGMSLDAYFKKKIFEPLGMKDSYFYLPKEKYNRLVNLYSEDSTGKVILFKGDLDLNGNMASDYPVSAGTYYSGGGGLSSTALDYAIFMQMLLNGGSYNGKHILSPSSVRMMTVSQFDKLDWPSNKMGLGFNVYDEKGAATSPLSPGSFDWGGMFSSTYWIDPKQKIVAQLFLNQFPNSHGEIHDKFKAVVYGAIDN